MFVIAIGSTFIKEDSEVEMPDIFPSPFRVVRVDKASVLVEFLGPQMKGIDTIPTSLFTASGGRLVEMPNGKSEPNHAFLLQKIKRS